MRGAAENSVSGVVVSLAAGGGRARGGASGAGVLGSAPWGPGASLTHGDFQKSDQVNTHIKTGDV